MISQTTKSLPGRPRSIEVHQAILQATLDLLAEVGYQGLSIEAIAARAGVGKATIYRRYGSKEELIAEAIASNRPQLIIPDTGSLWTDLEEVHKQAAELDLSPLGRQTIAMIISLASTVPQFAEIYWKKYAVPRRKAASIIFKRAQARGEMSPDVDPDLICDLMMGLLFKSILFQPETEEIESYMRRALDFLLQGVTSKSL